MSRHATWPIVAALGVALLALACAPAAPAPVPASNPAPAATAPQPAPSAAQPSSTAPAGGAQPAAFRPLPPTPRATVRAGGLGGAIDRAYFIGVDKGYYEEQGIELDVEAFRSAADMVPLLTTGRMDVGHGSTNPGFYNALSSGIGVKIVTDVTLMREPGPGVKNSMWLLVRKELADQSRNVADLRGRKFAVNGINNLNHLQLHTVLTYHSLSLEDVEVSQVPFPDMLAALSNGAVDAGLNVEPFLTLAEARGIATPVFDLGVAMPNHPAQQLFYGPDFIQQQPDVGKRFLVAYIKALRYIEDAFAKGINRDEAIDLFIANTQLKDRALYERMNPSYGETNGGVNLQALDTDQDFYLRQGVLKEKIAPSRLVDTTCADYAIQVLGRYQP
jgi:ABC-type nitrate/sulfonate/bicarbonate transport system substrate-binding protein